MNQPVDLMELIASRLLSAPEPIPHADDLLPDWVPEIAHEKPPVEAAVLIALVRRGYGHSVIYTQRSASLRAHSGQVAFPGGKIDPEDADAAQAALREAEEEVALNPADARVLGYLPHYYTGTNYLITPVVAEVVPQREFSANPQEVESLFEVPLSHLIAPASYQKHYVFRDNKEHWTWKIDHEDHHIWGITANLTRRFFDLALAGDGQ